MISLLVSIIPFIVALFARQNPSKILVIIVAIIATVVFNYVRLMIENDSLEFSSSENIGFLLGASFGKSVLGILATFVYAYIFRKYLR